MIIRSNQIEVRDVGGARLQFLGAAEVTGREAHTIIKGSLWPNTVVPLHSHSDPEYFFVLKGKLETYQESSGWRIAEEGDLVIVKSNEPHAWRNSFSEVADVIVITEGPLFNWLNNLSRDCDPTTPPSAPDFEYAGRLLEAAEKFGYWIATPEENSRIGIKLG